MQEVLQADWQEAWHSPQPPLAALSLRFEALMVLMCFMIYTSTIFCNNYSITARVFQVQLFRAEDSVAGVAETGNDIAMIVELLVLCSGKDINIGMSLAESLKSLGSCNDAHELY